LLELPVHICTWCGLSVDPLQKGSKREKARPRIDPTPNLFGIPRLRSCQPIIRARGLYLSTSVRSPLFTPVSLPCSPLFTPLPPPPCLQVSVLIWKRIYFSPTAVSCSQWKDYQYLALSIKVGYGIREVREVRDDLVPPPHPLRHSEA